MDDHHYDLDLVDGEFDPRTIWSCEQNHPELVVQDAKKVFDLSEKECELLRFILMKRGVNKWLLVRRKFIRLKHKVKRLLKDSEVGSERFHLLQTINEDMQNAAKMPRWVEWPKNVNNKRVRDELDVRIFGRHC